MTAITEEGGKFTLKNLSTDEAICLMKRPTVIGARRDVSSFVGICRFQCG